MDSRNYRAVWQGRRGMRNSILSGNGHHEGVLDGSYIEAAVLFLRSAAFRSPENDHSAGCHGSAINCAYSKSNAYVRGSCYRGRRRVPRESLSPHHFALYQFCSFPRIFDLNTSILIRCSDLLLTSMRPENRCTPHQTLSYFKTVVNSRGTAYSALHIPLLTLINVQQAKLSEVSWPREPHGQYNLFTDSLVLICIIQSDNQFPAPNIPFSHPVKTCVHVL